MGELCEVLGREAAWLRVRCGWDGYLGWLPAAAGSCFSTSEVAATQYGPLYRVDSDYAIVREAKSGVIFHLSTGACLWPHHIPEGFELILGNLHKADQVLEFNLLKMKALALQWLGSPYRWGGRHRGGVDCSGFMQVLWASQGIPIPRDAADQYQGAPHKWSPDSPPDCETVGLLAFYKEAGKETGITHVGLMLEPHRILHASGEVRLDDADITGISRFNEPGAYSHHLLAFATF
jgi:hypothetical protein